MNRLLLLIVDLIGTLVGLIGSRAGFSAVFAGMTWGLVGTFNFLVVEAFVCALVNDKLGFAGEGVAGNAVNVSVELCLACPLIGFCVVD